MMHILDDESVLRNLDTKDMFDSLFNFPQACEDTITKVNQQELDELHREYSNIITVGVGGSGIAGEILNDWLQDSMKIPIEVSRSNNLPQYVNEKTLVFINSYSGNTNETIQALKQATEKRCSIITITSGGVIEKIAKREKLINIKLPTGLQPRASLPNQFFTLASILKKLNYIGESWKQVDEAIQVLHSVRENSAPEKEYNSNEPKQIAQKLTGKIPFIYGPQIFKGVSYRLSTQFNENSKIPSGYGFFPEVFHNAIMFNECNYDFLKNMCIIILEDPYLSNELIVKIKKFELMFSSKIPVYNIKACGKGRLSRILSTLYTGDYISTYLAILLGLDPSSVCSIIEIKDN